jgi:hypothetical protein
VAQADVQVVDAPRPPEAAGRPIGSSANFRVIGFEQTGEILRRRSQPVKGEHIDRDRACHRIGGRREPPEIRHDAVRV